MNTIGIRELKQNASEVIQRVSGGEWLDVTDRGRPVAQISPINSSALGRLIDA
ncbi:MAG: type II toxin-antitoxin system Phd/YefM family antitoxin, partial [Actinomycetota bacterium]